jgi:hypothetical protein
MQVFSFYLYKIQGNNFEGNLRHLVRGAGGRCAQLLVHCGWSDAPYRDLNYGDVKITRGL